ncbi:GerAB/ArcD/ProY family transporter [Paenibacillus wynnii]|uniref:GerAB/ArcD/ProY family transporter n=1 Tax=Paenibacillus wynnii TaxID=268407 RepID=UPI00278CF712|nr:endospore germination permease [Paenibacillus wynnii]MDQ0194277.1 spore germination protein KB [Paenibacillus wynnii]
MLDKGKISAVQMSLLLYPTVLATSFLSMPSLAAQYAQNDLWMTGILSSFFGLLTIYVATRLHDLFPKESIIQQSERVIGVLPGKIIGILFFIFYIHVTGMIVRMYTEFVSGQYLFKTPPLLIIFIIVLLSSIAVRGGIETLARCAVIFTPILMFSLLFLLLLFPSFDVRNIFPILSHGIIPVLKASALPQSWVSELFFISFLLPHLTDPKKGRKWGFLTLGAIVLSIIYMNLITLLLLGSDTANKTYPILVVFRYISLAGIFENLESLLLAMWIVGNFIKISLFLYVASISFAQTLRLSDYRPSVFPLGILVIVFSLWDIPNFSKLGEHLRYVAPFEIPLVMVLIPVLILIIARLRGIRTSKR